MEYAAPKEPVRIKLQGQYILRCLKDHFLSGDAYINQEDIYDLCRRATPHLSYPSFQDDFRFLLRHNFLRREGRKIYLTKTLRYEESTARLLAHLLRHNSLVCPKLPENIVTMSGTSLCEEQKSAVEMALSHQLSLVLGGAGTGKSSLVQAIVECASAREWEFVLCAPTGKAACNLTTRTLLPARTVHSALGFCPNDDFLEPVHWNYIKLVIVDEASMMTLEMLAGILNRVPSSCCVVLLGDYNQLLSVGSGNVIHDLLRLKFPCTWLNVNHRQIEGARELRTNVTNFSSLHTCSDLAFGDSFQLKCMDKSTAKDALIQEASRRYLRGESIQVLSPYNDIGELSVLQLNLAIRDRVNPLREGMKTFYDGFRDGDKVIITKNDKTQNCCNGDVGFLHIISNEKDKILFRVILPDGRCPFWQDIADLALLRLAYALTVHKSQGSGATRS